MVPRTQLCFALMLVIALTAAAPASARPFKRDNRPQVTKPPLRTRISASVRRASTRTANTIQKIHRKTPPAVRHGIAAAGLGAIAIASIDTAAGSQLMTLKGMLSTGGLLLTATAAVQQTTAALQSLFPRQMKKAEDKLRRSPVGPLVPKEKSPTLTGRLRRFLGIGSSYANRPSQPPQTPPRRRAPRNTTSGS